MFEQRTTAGSGTLGSIHFHPGQIKSQDVELAGKSVNLREGEQSSVNDIYTGGITVTQSVFKS